MERLTERMIDGEAQPNCSRCTHYKECGDEHYCDDGESCYEKILDRLAELEDKLESGQLVELPCKVGDTVWALSGTKGNVRIVEENCAGFEYGSISNCDVPHLIILTPRVRDEHYGMVFTDKAQAEARLKELQEK